MALTIGELVGYIRADGSDFQRNLARSQLRMEGFRVDVNGRLRDVRGRFVSESRVMGQALADGFSDAERAGTRIVTVYNSVADAQSRTMRGRMQQIQAASRRMGRELRDSFGRVRSFLRDLDLGRLRSFVGALGGVAASGGKIAATFGAAVPLAAGLAATLANIAPAAGVGATATLAVASAAGALKIGMLGVSDAVSAAFEAESASDLEEALKGLSPNARAFVRELHSMKGAFDDLKTSVQDQLFQGLDKTLARAGKVTLPVLESSLTQAASALNLMGKQVLSTAAGLAQSGTLGKALKHANNALYDMQGLPATIVQGLVQIGAAAGPSFERLSDAGGRALERLSQKMASAFASGAMQRAIEHAIGLIGDLAEVAGNVGDIVGSIFSAANASAAGFIGTLQTITASLAEAFDSPAVQSGLKAIFETMGTLASTVAPLLVMALQAIAPVFTALGPPVQRLIEALGEALSPIIEALGPVLEAAAVAVGALVDAVAPLLPIVGELIAALLPALTPLLELIADLFRQLAPVVLELVTAIAGGLQPILTALTPVIASITEVLASLVAAVLPILTALIAALAPVIADLAVVFADLLVALAPVITSLGMLYAEILTALTPILIPIIEVVGRLARVFAGELARVITAVVIPALNLVSSLLRGDFSGALEAGKQLAQGFGRTVVRLFYELPGKVFAALSNLASRLHLRMAQAGQAMAREAGRKILDVVAKVKELPGKAVSALGNLQLKLVRAGRQLIQGFIDGIAAKIPSVQSTLGGITSALTSWKGPESLDKKILTPAGRFLIEGFQRGIDGQIPALRSQLQALTRDLPAMGGMELAMGGMPGGMRFGQAAAAPRVEVISRNIIDIRGGDDDMQRLIRSWVDIEGGGDVQSAFGKN